MRFTAAYALGRFGPEAREAIPDLLNTLNAETNRFAKDRLTYAIRNIDTNAIPMPLLW